MKRSLCTAAMLLTLLGCSSTPVGINVTISPGAVTLEPGQTARFTATISGTPDTALTWTSTGGELIAGQAGATFVALAPGSFDVTVTSVAKPDAFAKATVVVAPAPSAPRLVFLSDQSVILSELGEAARLEVRVVGADGQPIDTGRVSWTSADESIASVLQDGDRAAVVTARTKITSYTTIRATFEDLEAEASILVSKPSSGTVLISSSLVESKTETTVTLVRNAKTEALQSGQRLVSGSSAGILVRITSVNLSADEVVLSTEPTSLAEAFDELTLSVSTEPLNLTVQFVGPNHAVLRVAGQDGNLETTTVLDDVTCKTSNGAPANLDLVGANLTLTSDVYGEIAFSILLGEDHFLAKIGSQLSVGVDTGKISFNSPVSGKVSCSLELPPIALAPVSAAVFTVWVGLIPVLGVEIEAKASGASFELSGPKGGLGATLEGGIEYLEASGWAAIAYSDVNGDFEPFSSTATFAAPFAARALPFGQLDVGLGVDLGTGDLSSRLLEARFVELRGYGYLDFTLPAPTEVVMSSYEGPSWTMGVGASGALKAEFTGALPDLLEVIGIPVNVGGTLELFDASTELGKSPTLTVTANPPELVIKQGESKAVALTALSSGEENGTVGFWVSKDGGDTLGFLTSGALENGVAETTWTVSETGGYEIYARLSSDLASQDKPYAAADPALVTVAEALEEPEDRGPLGEAGPWQGAIFHAAAGDCNATGWAVTVRFNETANGTLSGRLAGRACKNADCSSSFTGPLSATLSGSRAGDVITFVLVGDITGVFEGELIDDRSFFGDGYGLRACEDSWGTWTSGYFTLTSTNTNPF